MGDIQSPQEPVKHDFLDFMDRATRNIQSDYERIKKHVRKDPGTAGDQGEENWAKLIREWLPAIYPVELKGSILTENQQTSPQVDLLILHPYYPQAFLNNKYYFSSGVVGAIECKLTLDRKNLFSSIKNAVEIKRMYPKGEGSFFQEVNSAPIIGLLSHSHSWKGTKEQIIDRVENFIMDSIGIYANHPRDMIDFICIANLATWIPIKDPAISGPGLLNPQKHLDVMIGYGRSDNKQYPPIGVAITYLLGLIAENDNMLRPLSNYFNKIVKTNANTGHVINFSYEGIISEGIKDRLLGIPPTPTTPDYPLVPRPFP